MVTTGGRIMIHTKYCSQGHCDFYISIRGILPTVSIYHNHRLGIVLIVVFSTSASALGQFLARAAFAAFVSSDKLWLQT